MSSTSWPCALSARALTSAGSIEPTRFPRCFTPLMYGSALVIRWRAMEARLPAGANPFPNPSALIAGVDGCRGGWVVARATAIDGTVVDVTRIDRLEALIAEVDDGRLDAVALDMPIGLPRSGRRAADAAS